MRRSLFGFLALSVVVCACTAPDPNGTGGSGGSPPVPETPTYYRDIKVILDANCTGCHKAGGVAPMALENAEQVQPMAYAMRYAVQTRHMPPWMAAPGCNEYAPDRSLSDVQIQTITRWAEVGAPIGDPLDEPPPLPRPNSELSRVDLQLGMAAAYTPRARADDYRCFVLDWPAAARQFITGIGVTPGVVPLVHHAIAYLMTPSRVAAVRWADALDPAPGYSCPGGVTGGWITSWEPGGHGIDFPHGSGIAVDPGSAIVLQVHYNTMFSNPAPDRSSVEFALADSVETPARTLTWMDSTWPFGTMPIAAGDPDVAHWFQAIPSELNTHESMQIHWADIHMHTLGSRGELSVQRADGSTECLLRVDDYEFSHQETFLLKNPVTLRPGDQLRVECHWDNTAANQPFINGQQQTPRNVNWGEGTTDEMCLGNFLFSTP